MSKRAAKSEREQRLAELAELLAARAPRRALVRHAMQKWSLGERAAQGYVAEALERLRSTGGEDAELSFALALASYELLFRRQLAAGDLRGARGSLDKIVSLLGLARRSEQPTLAGLEAQIIRLEGELATLEAQVP